VGVMIFPGKGRVAAPDAHMSYASCASLRRKLAAAEGFDLNAMLGFVHVRGCGVRTLSRPGVLPELRRPPC